MNAERRRAIANVRECDLERIQADLEMVHDAAIDKGSLHEQRAYEEALSGVLIALTALGRAIRLSEAQALTDSLQQKRLREQLEASIREKGIAIGEPR